MTECADGRTDGDATDDADGGRGESAAGDGVTGGDRAGDDAPAAPPAAGDAAGDATDGAATGRRGGEVYVVLYDEDRGVSRICGVYDRRAAAERHAAGDATLYVVPSVVRSECPAARPD